MHTTRRVVCAAIRAEDGDLLLGVRHYSADMHVQINARRDGERFCHRGGEDQGFVDQYGKYMTRGEAAEVAIAAGQVMVLSRPPKLYSEDLY